MAEYFHMSHSGFCDAVIICGLDQNWQEWVPARSSVTGPLKKSWIELGLKTSSHSCG